MRDQADKLRQLLLNKNLNNNTTTSNVKEKETRVIAITSGKGGVGKTNFTINLAISLSNLGYKIIVFDADIGLGNIDIVLGVVPRNNISSVINGTKDILDIMTDGPNGIKIIPGGSGVKDLNDLSEEKVDNMIKQFTKLEGYADFILIDTGAGLSNTVLSFVRAAEEIILVTTPEPTSLTDAYAMIKTLTVYEQCDNLKVIVNRAENAREADEIFEKLSRATNKFLNIKLENLGYILNSKLVVDSVKSQNPLLLMYPNSAVSSKINAIALKLMGSEKHSLKQHGIGMIMRKLTGIYNKEDS